MNEASIPKPVIRPARTWAYITTHERPDSWRAYCREGPSPDGPELAVISRAASGPSGDGPSRAIIMKEKRRTWVQVPS